EHIFEPFFSTKTEVEGTGLGLYVSYMIINKHNGEILIESEKGTGSIFTISLPVET
ncbi:MAG: two-component sensor histidine kinase, partial [Desulfobacterales bacterium]|nr:two-component sensor histidine kinase [Desulfobacterales bacterium]